MKKVLEELYRVLKLRDYPVQEASNISREPIEGGESLLSSASTLTRSPGMCARFNSGRNEALMW